MRLRTAAAHLLVLVATLSGIVGMGMVFQGVEHGNMPLISQGVPLLFVSLWWAGRELGRSILASRSRKHGA